MARVLTASQHSPRPFVRDKRFTMQAFSCDPGSADEFCNCFISNMAGFRTASRESRHESRLHKSIGSPLLFPRYLWPRSSYVAPSPIFLS